MYEYPPQQHHYYNYYIFFAILAFVGWLIWKNRNRYPELIHSRWGNYFPDLQFSALEFYESVEKTLARRMVPDITLERIDFSEQNETWGKHRLYLRVRRAPYSFDICAAPFGTGFFVSWWFGEDIGCLMRILLLIPVLGTYLKYRMLNKTYFRMDSESMFEQTVHTAVMESIDAVTTAKGLRSLSELERQPKSLRRNP